MNILFIGDIVGRVGRRMVKENLDALIDKYDIDFVIANGENATHGKGLTRNHYFELIDEHNHLLHNPILVEFQFPRSINDLFLRNVDRHVPVDNDHILYYHK